MTKFIEFGETYFRIEGRRRLECREYSVVAVSDEDRTTQNLWPGLGSVGMVVRQRKIGETEEPETSFFIAGMAPKICRLASHLRGHWTIENSQHDVLDVTFAEDASRIRSGTAPEISASIRRMALNILQRDKTVKDNIGGKRLRADGDETVLNSIWSAFSTI